MSLPSLPRGARLRLASLALACAWLAGSLGPAAHLALVEHVHCAVHDALEHHGHGEHERACDAAELPGAPSDEGPRAQAPLELEEHEACALALGLRPEPCVLAARPRIALAPEHARQDAPTGAERALGAVCLVRLAPKHSPPA